MNFKILEYVRYLMFFISLQVLSAGTTGKISGNVKSKANGEALIGANVMVNGTPYGAATDLKGDYFILQVPPGNYSVKFAMIGYQTLTVDNVKVRVDLTSSVDAVLNEGTVGLEEVIVQAERPMIQTDVTYSQANISSEEVEMLPVEEFEDILSLQAGVVSSGGEIHVRGGRGGEISYMVDGITVTDPYDSGIAVEIENNAIQELQFISGTFNAEYGQAMSGIVNIVTKDGSYRSFKGNISSSLGDYFTNDPIFPELMKTNLNNISDLKANFEGPIIPEKISLFTSGRINRNNGYLHGEQIFYPNSFLWSDSENTFNIDSTIGLGNNFIPDLNDTLKNIIDSLRNNNSFDQISMNWIEQKTVQSKISYRITSKIKFGYNWMYSDTKSQSYSKLYLWNPLGRSYSFNTRIGNIFRADISINPSTFANIMYSNATNHYRTHLSDDSQYFEVIEEADNVFSNTDSIFFLLDTNLYDTDPRIFDYSTGNNFGVGGKYMDVYSRKSDVSTYKAEITSQLNSKHQVKAGAEYRSTIINLNDLSVLSAAYTDYKPIVLRAENNTIHNSFQSMNNPFTGEKLKNRNPIEFSGYLQDKIETDDLVVNMGIRFDYFNSQFWVLNDSEDPNYMSPVKPINRWHDLDQNGEISEDEMVYQNLKTDSLRLLSNAQGEPWYQKADAKTQFSPRFALAFPITDKGYLHFSYGHFFQNPNFSYIYDNPEFEVPAASGVNSTMGNANMEPQRTTQYEVGFSQQIGQDIGVELTGYFKDIRNLNSTEIKKSFIAGDRYGLYVNKDHANSRGITLAISKRSMKNFSGNLDYTYSISEGNASDPTAAFYDEQSDIEPEKMLVPLDWDQRHTISGTATYHPMKNSGISFVFNYGSGLPYTTEFAGQRTAFENNGRKPPTYNVDMRSFYHFSLSEKLKISAHINIYNLFDIRNELLVYNDTGRATYSLLPTYTPQYSGPMLNTLNEYLISPSYYSEPRQVKFGLSIGAK